MNRLWVLLITVCFISCQKESKVPYVLFSGKITGDIKELQITNNYGFTEKIAVKEDGVFSDTITIDKEGFYYCQFSPRKGTTLYFQKGANLTLNMNLDDHEGSIKYVGKGAVENNYLAAKRLKEKEYNAHKIREFYSYGPDTFKIKIKEVKAAIHNLIDNTKELPSDFAALEKLNNQYDYLRKINRYEGVHRYMSQKKSVIPDDFYKELDTVNFLNHVHYENNKQYKGLVREWYGRMKNELVEKDSISNTEALKKVITLISDKPKIRNEFLRSNIGELDRITSEELDGFYAVLNTSTNKSDLERFKSKYEAIKSLEKGSPSPVFNFENYKGDYTALKDFTGKYVYIDIWATWCVPCIKEIPSLKEVEKKYQNKNIEFISISIDEKKDYDKWKKFVKDKELSGVQLYADKNWDSDFIAGYLIRSIPRFILIDPDGNIVAAKAPRPSSPELIKLFKELKI